MSELEKVLARQKQGDRIQKQKEKQLERYRTIIEVDHELVKAWVSVAKGLETKETKRVKFLNEV